MELDSFLASPRWEILQIISAKPSSPMEISEKLNTTVSYISQQLKLLEATGLIKKERTGSVERGKPRTLFSISKELVYLIPLSRDFVAKKAVYMTDYHKFILKIWFVEKELLQKQLYSVLFQIGDNLDKVKLVCVDSSKTVDKVLVISEDKLIRESLGKNKGLPTIEFISENYFEKADITQCFFVHDPLDIFNRRKMLKGGITI